MSDAMVHFHSLDKLDTPSGVEQSFSFACPKYGRRCGALIIAGTTDLKRDPQGQNGGVAQWDWDGNRDAPTFKPSINCKGCWHGFIENGRCVNTSHQDEPEPSPR